MIVYSATRREFSDDVRSNLIEERILDRFLSRMGHKPSESEILSWRNSLQQMHNALDYGEIPDDAGVAIEYRIPLTSRRVDFMLSGTDSNDRDSVVIVELKQWSDVEKTGKDAIVRTWLGGALREVTHPSYQAWTYAALIQDFNVEIQERNISLQPCAYLHNCRDPFVIRSDFYGEHLCRAPVFLRNDVKELAAFLKKYVRKGDRSRILYRIEHGRLRPSRNLADHLASLLDGNREFVMIDHQKIVYETALERMEQAGETGKHVLLVEGGPGTGKSVVAVNLLVELTNREFVTHYVSRNAAPRAVYESKLAGTLSKTRITNLFKGSGAYVDCEPGTIDCLIVDEAHRLNAKSGFYQNQGDNQIREIIRAARLSVFFLDQDQRVTMKDIGERSEIMRHAAEAGAHLTELKLQSQFRCNGSDGYLSWVSNALQIEETASPTLDGIDFDFRVFDSPSEMRDEIERLNQDRNKSRMVAGYCWDWESKRNPEVMDVTIPEHGFEMRWNLDSDGSLWIIKDGSVSEIGCIHTCQGLELDYVGVIVGEDFIVRNGKVETNALKRSKNDSSVRGYKSMLRENPAKAKVLADRIVKNTYRTLMTRGQKGCFLFCVDQETNEYFRNFVEGKMETGGVQIQKVLEVYPDPHET